MRIRARRDHTTIDTGGSVGHLSSRRTRVESSSTPELEDLHDRLASAAQAMLAKLRPEMIRIVLAGPEFVVVSGRRFRHGSAELRVYGPALRPEAQRFVGAMTDGEVVAFLCSPMVDPDFPEAVVRGERDPREAARLALIVLLDSVCAATMETLWAQAETPHGKSTLRAEVASGSA
jgi:hypothetical protein